LSNIKLIILISSYNKLILTIKVIIVRKDLGMGVGKIAAQVGHAGKYL